jgi:imidazole glycerol-phosphate synthase subunit HisH
VSELVIVDYGMGNLHSVYRTFRRIGADPLVTSEPARVARAERLVLPGVGHFGKAMQNLEARGLLEALNDAVVDRRAPVLGICLGMQLFAKRSDEGDAAGLGWIDAQVVRFKVPDPVRYKVPHMGWNSVVQRKECRLTAGLAAPLFYFVHAYHLVCGDTGDVLFETDYAYRFVSAVARGNVVGVQFHPEKSHQSGAQLLRSFLTL